MRRNLIIVAVISAALVASGLVAGSALYRAYPVQMTLFVGLGRNYLRSWTAPVGTTATEVNPAYRGPGAMAPAPLLVAAPAIADTGDWPSYNKTLTSERFSQLREINAKNVGKLKVVCAYDTKQYSSFESGLIMVGGSLIGTTQSDIFSLDPTTCAENWRTHEDIPPAVLSANRGPAYLDGMLYRGQNGDVLAYDFKTGKLIWRTAIANASKGEFVPAAPIAWDGLVFIGNAGGDGKGVKGRMYALDAKTGKIVWEFYLVPKDPDDPVRGPQGASPLDRASWNNGPRTPISGGATWTSFTLDPTTGELFVPGGNPSPAYAIGVREGENFYTDSVVVLDAKTGAYINHFKLVPRDWHDWDVSNPPALIETLSGKKIMVATPKDGYLYGFDRASNAMLYRVPVTRIENSDVPFSTESEVHFCPGASGGAEWNGPAYDPSTNLIMIGENDWCTTVVLQTEQQLENVKPGGPWFGMAARNPFHIFGRQDRADGNWGGWVYAADADTGVWKWRLRSNYPIVSGMTPTAGGLVFFGDVGGNFYALDASDGRKLWGQKIGGAIAGGVITYVSGGSQKIAVATGYTNVAWPTEVTTGKIVVLGVDLDNASLSQ